MIAEPDLVAKTAPGTRFDQLASSLVGLIAVVVAILAVVQVNQSQTGERAQLMAARLADDIVARTSVSSLAADFAGQATLRALALGLDASNRQIAAENAGDLGAQAVGAADQKASDLLMTALADTAASSGGPPLDAYAAGLVRASVAEMQAEVAMQRHQVDVADDAGGRSRLAVLGLSFSALAGVLVALALVLRESRSGWIALGAAGGIAALAILAVLLALI